MSSAPIMGEAIAWRSHGANRNQAVAETLGYKGYHVFASDYDAHPGALIKNSMAGGKSTIA